LEQGTGAHETLDCHQFLDDACPGTRSPKRIGVRSAVMAGYSNVA
jgi:hypothetical protein